MWTKEITDDRPPRCERMTGLAQEQVADLATKVSVLVGVWQRPVGRPRVMGLYRAVVLTLFLLRHNNSQDVAGELFGCSQASVSRVFTALYPLLGVVNADLVAQVKAEAANAPLIVDGFIAPTGERPGAQANMFSDKHHECGFNVQVVANTGGRLVDVGDPVPGARHDAYAFDASGIAQRWAAHMTEGGPGLLGDKGYQGTGPHTPYKKPPGEQLGEVLKDCNRAHSSVRSAVERAIAHLTRWRILDTGWRGRLSEFPDLLRTVTALEIYRVRG
jgi:DDE superfamily endonuclease/Helix-turn-helix of DDE superfamily endonuclease